MEKTDTILTAEHITKAYPLPDGGELLALNDVSVQVPRGQLTILKGRSGSGKTTLMNILCGLDRPTRGQAFLEGKEITAMGDRERTSLRRKEIGFVFQSVALIPIMTAAENVEYALRLAGWQGDRKRRVQECLEMVGLGKRMSHLPNEMSGGEQQRVAIARAIAHGPKLIFADEPTGELDTNTALQVVKIFKELNRSQGVSILMTTHDKGFMEIGLAFLLFLHKPHDNMKNTLLCLLATVAVFCSCSEKKAPIPLYGWDSVGKNPNLEEVRAKFQNYKAHGFTGICVQADLADIPAVSAIAHEEGLEYHAWKPCMLQSGKPHDWYCVNRLGQSADEFPAYVQYYKALDPANPEVQDYIVSMLTGGSGRAGRCPGVPPWWRRRPGSRP